jgi:shikimate dehydrogenase
VSHDVPEVLFVGMKTEGSLVHQAMPLWGSLLPSSLRVRGVSIDVGAPDERYVELLEEIRGDEGIEGAVVSVHKVRLLAAGRAQLAWLDPIALACEEVNAVRRAGSELRGYARDPISVGRVLESIWPGDDGDVICIGAGGTARALAYHLFRSRQPRRVVCADTNEGAIEQLARLTGGAVEGHVGDGPWDKLVAGAPPGSLIVNATGMGKDRAGSPLTDEASFPPGAVVWELNYRGDLRFLALARSQAGAAGLHVHDGWRLFCHGWAAALGAVLGMEDDPALGERFAEAAAPIRP